MTGPVPPLGDQLRGLAEGLAEGLGGLLSGAGPVAGADHSAECRTCPVCTALAVLRGQRPDLSEALADVLATAATALRGLTRPADAPDREPAPAADVPDPEPAPPPAPVQRIEVA
ncbi:hypothetical protein SAMN03159343_2296 [Klenkia marina]|uniref:Uncharacterized protein n=1 Tax=Klenkia marina TaxID=1960309 RepID=A0A1G4Y8U4_9ACTN|nr:hypothetical protein [Klenkia marina]SCX49886.1 hypothetical protein SAMN03159343_2296 [Klenkia marina]